ncbi:hypothetical protein GCM10025865_01540 [Paraoerskovia sediminicola]|uniref:DUF2017 domain-containing protein n=1 Tax=Paraoerskovia sediminicola TaxID=1138587 RepID=A0ABM8FYN5_9CELL|nr:hypothetical protein GCM10025865_01540 [Paraoerskovia sediminicola]
MLAQVLADVAQMLGTVEGDTDRTDDDGRPAGAAAPGDPAGPVERTEVPLDELPPHGLPSEGSAAPGLPADPALARLLPDGSHDDADVSSEFRRLTQHDLVDRKTAALMLLANLLLAEEPEPGTRAPLLVRREDAGAVAAALTDLRLVLAARLGIETDAQVEAVHEELVAGSPDEGAADGPDDGAGAGPRRFFASVFATAGWLQDSLVEGMLGDLG